MINGRRSNRQSDAAIIFLVLTLCPPVTAVHGSELFAGAASVSITPSQPVALLGQVHTRIADQVESPLTATALAIETRDGEKVLDLAIMVSCDLAGIPDDLQDRVRTGIKQRLPDFDVSLTHHVKDIQLPVRVVTEQEFTKAKAFCDAAATQDKLDPRQSLQRWWNQDIVDRYEKQKANPHYTMELHCLRLGDVAVCTNPFELYTEFGVRIKARSKAEQTFVVQLACGGGGYVPTKEAVQGGSYSTEVFSNQVGPEGGDSLVDQTVESINAMW